ncbi:aldose 1-epimerase family protein [Parablastomonas sp. CN1-191]|uniref:aldose 1-epimerase family protein n=1 Tax=Parablastomonas sp. CN1-191 TaxID=3400908 RepID=UPI003BF86424
MSDLIVIAADGLTAAVNPLGAELWSLKDARADEWMTDADPAFWTGHAPILFPIVGALNDGHYRLDGRDYAMGKHGFARTSRFDVVRRDGAKAVLRLADNAETRAQYPFAFTLEVAFALRGGTLEQVATVTNAGATAMPLSFGFHPAFAWPLPRGGAKHGHAIVFDRDEPQDVARIDAAGLLARYEATPVRGNRLALNEALFANDALIWTTLASRGCRYVSPGGAELRLEWPDSPMLGVWQKPGARYVCIEPWQGHADPAGFSLDFTAKPGSVVLAPGASRSWRLSIAVCSAP